MIDVTYIYKALNEYYSTPKSNYNAVPSDARKVQRWKGFTSAQEIIDYCIKWFGSSPADFTIIDA